MDVAEKAKGVGIYSTPYCLAKDVLATADATSNCPMVNTNEPYATEIMNALELKWAFPYEIPSDRTTATITCGVDIQTENYITIYQSSLMT